MNNFKKAKDTWINLTEPVSCEACNGNKCGTLVKKIASFSPDIVMTVTPTEVVKGDDVTIECATGSYFNVSFNQNYITNLSNKSIKSFIITFFKFV